MKPTPVNEDKKRDLLPLFLYIRSILLFRRILEGEIPFILPKTPYSPLLTGEFPSKAFSESRTKSRITISTLQFSIIEHVIILKAKELRT